LGGKPSRKWEIQGRREKIMLLLSRGYSQSDVMQELGISRMTLSRDMHYLNKQTSKGLFGMAKETFGMMYYNCVQGLNEILTECWKKYRNEDNDPQITEFHKVAWLRLAREIQIHKFTMFQNGPATLELGTLREKVEDLRRFALEDRSRSGTFTKRADLHSYPSPSSSSSLPYKEFDVRDLDKP
jgi:hypothetical protein